MQPGADGEALVGQRDGGLEQARPGQLAVLAVGLREHRHRAGGAHRAAAGHGHHEGQGLALFVEEELLVGPGGRGLAAIEGLDAAPVVVQQEGTAADAAGLRLHQREHHLHGDGRVHRAAAGAQDARAGLSGQRVGRRHGLAREGPARLTVRPEAPSGCWMEEEEGVVGVPQALSRLSEAIRQARRVMAMAP